MSPRSVAELRERAEAIAASALTAPPARPAPWLGDAGTTSLAAYLDHTLLRPDATREQIGQLCSDARSFGVRAVCVNGSWVAECARALAGSDTAVAAVVGFPLGAAATRVKVAEARAAVEDGAAELDMVMALGAAAGGEWNYVGDEIEAVVTAVPGGTVKVILETAMLRPVEIAHASLVAAAAGAHFVKTSTGFHAAGGATTEAVRIMRAAVGLRGGVKASGGVRSLDAALAMLAAGANRIGMSSTGSLAEFLGPAAPSIARLLAGALPVEPARGTSAGS